MKENSQPNFRSPAKWTGLLLFLVLLLLAFPLRQRDLEFMIEPDFNWQMIEAFRKFFSTFDFRILTKPGPYVYLDGQFMIYGAFDWLLRLASERVSAHRLYFSNDLSYALGAAL